MEIRYICISATWFYEYFVKTCGLTRCAILGAIMHFSFVVGTIGGLFIEGSMYQLYEGYESIEECPAQLTVAQLEDAHALGTLPTSNSSILTDYTTPCTPPSSLLSIFVMLSCCALSRMGLWMFDLAVNQMFQEWVDPKEVNLLITISCHYSKRFPKNTYVAWACFWGSERRTILFRLRSFWTRFHLDRTMRIWSRYHSDHSLDVPGLRKLHSTR